MAMGALRKAGQVLLQRDGVLDLEVEGRLDALAQLHPTAYGACPETPRGSAVRNYRTDLIQEVIRKRLPRGSAPGLDGWTTEHLLALMEDAGCVRGITLLVRGLCNGRWSSGPLRDLISTARLLAFSKEDSGSGTGIRSIAIQSIWLRLAEHAALATVGGALPPVLSPGDAKGNPFPFTPP